MPTGPAKKQARFHIQLCPKAVQVRRSSWERMRSTMASGLQDHPDPEENSKLASSGSSKKRRMKTLRLGGYPSRRVRLQRSVASVRRWVVSVSGWASVAVRSKAKVGLAFLREALKLLVTGLHAPSTEMSMAGYHMGPYRLAVDRLEVHARHRAWRSGPHSGHRKGVRCSNGHGRSRGPWNHIGTERIITFPGSTLARRHAPHKGLATIAESAAESEIRV